MDHLGATRRAIADTRSKRNDPDTVHAPQHPRGPYPTPHSRPTAWPPLQAVTPLPKIPSARNRRPLARPAAPSHLRSRPLPRSRGWPQSPVRGLGWAGSGPRAAVCGEGGREAFRGVKGGGPPNSTRRFLRGSLVSPAPSTRRRRSARATRERHG